MAHTPLNGYYRKSYQDFTKGLNNRDSALTIPASQLSALEDALVNDRNLLEKRKGHIVDASPFPNVADSFIRMCVNYKRGSTVDNLVVAAQDDGNTNANLKVDIKQTTGDGTYSYIGYTTGTATFTNASTGVSGSGTTWSTNLKAGDKIKPNAYSNWYEIQSVTSDTALVLTTNYTDTTVTSGAYLARIMFHKDFIPVGLTFNNNFIVSNGSETPVSWDDSTTKLLTAAPKAQFLVKHKKRLFALRTAASPSGLYWSAVDDETTWDPAGYASVFDNDGGNIVNGISFGDSLIIFKDNGTMFQVAGNFDQDLVGSPTYIRKIDVPSSIGIIAGRTAVVHYDNKLYFLAQTGIYSMDPWWLRISKESWDINNTVLNLVFKSSTTSTKTYSFTNQSQWNTGTLSGMRVSSSGVLSNYVDSAQLTGIYSTTNPSFMAVDTDSSGNSHIVYVDTAGSNYIYYVKWSVDGTLSAPALVTSMAGAINVVAIRVRSNGHIVVAAAYNTGSIFAFNYDGTSWSSPIGASSASGTMMAMVMRSDDLARIAFISGNNLVYCQEVSNSVPTTWTNTTTTIGAGIKAVDLALDADGSPYVGLRINQTTDYIGEYSSTNDGTTWTAGTSNQTGSGAEGSPIHSGNWNIKIGVGATTRTFYYMSRRASTQGQICSIKSGSSQVVLDSSPGCFFLGGCSIANKDYVYYGNTGSVSGNSGNPATETFSVNGATVTASSPLVLDYLGSEPYFSSPNGFNTKNNVSSMVAPGASVGVIQLRRIAFVATWQSPVESDSTLTQWGTYDVTGEISNGNTVAYTAAVSSTSTLPAETAITPGSVVSSDPSKVFFQTTITITLAALAVSSITSLVVNFVGSGVDAKYPVGTIFNNELYLAVTETGQANNNKIILLDKGNAWVLWNKGVSSFAYYKNKLYAGSSTNGDILILNQNYDDNGAAYTFTATSKEDILGSIELDKDIYKIYVLFEVKSAGSFVASYRLDNFITPSGSTWIDTTVDQTSAGIAEILVGQKAKSVQLKFSNANATEQTTIVGFVILYGYLSVR